MGLFNIFKKKMPMDDYMRGAPILVYKYYLQANSYEKSMLEELYNKYDGYILAREREFLSKNMNKAPFMTENLWGAMILRYAYVDLREYTNNKGYPEILIAIFYEKDKIDLASGPVESELLSKYL